MKLLQRIKEAIRGGQEERTIVGQFATEISHKELITSRAIDWVELESGEYIPRNWYETRLQLAIYLGVKWLRDAGHYEEY